MGHWQDVLSELAEPTRSLRQAIPEPWEGFAQLHRGVMKDGALSAAFKEIIALAIAVADECDGCVAAHARAAARRGATPEQVAEGLGVALLMMGGPGSVYGPMAWQAYNEFRPTQGETPPHP
ncbi:MAG TPA: carboxymuconolactone decarboxylase family protein [Acidimicrobiia bacterium]|nr:carboxymuconolactone decarboxylase family protein [Acidimicrobiia bacterium]